MKNSKSLLATSVACSLLTLSTPSNAAGFQLAEYSATGLGRAYAGEAAMADNAGAQWRNPAMLTYLEGTQISAGAVYVDPNVDIEGTVGGSATSSSDYASDGVMPNFYASHQYDERLAFGLAIGTNYAMKTELGDGFEASHLGNEAEITTSEVNFNLAYKVTPELSFGGGIRYVMAEGKVGSKATTGALSGQTLAYVEGDTTDWGWQVGATWQINDANRVGIAYKSEVNLKLEGKAKGTGIFGDPLSSSSGYLPLTLPATAELASFHKISDKLTVHGSINWTDWSSFEKLEAFIDSQNRFQEIKQENWNDNFRFAVGATYQPDSSLKLRAGIAYDTEAVTDETRSITIPDTDRTWLSLGAGYDWSENLVFDVGVSYVIGKSAPVSEQAGSTLAAAGYGDFEGTTSSHVWIAGAQASYRF